MELAAIDGELRSQVPTKPPRTGAGGQPLPTELPGLKHRHEAVSCQRAKRGTYLVKIDEDVSEHLDV